MLPIPTTLDKIQSCWQIPYIAHFCTLFNKYLDLPSFDTKDLEQALQRDPEKERLVPELITRLLRHCPDCHRVKNRIGINTFEPFLELFVRKTCEAEKHLTNPYVAAAAANLNAAAAEDDTPLSFDELPVEHKAAVIQLLCEARFEAEDALKIIDSANPDSLRVLPLGYDSSAAAYYYFFGTRLYKESNRFATKSEPKGDLSLNGSLLNGSASVVNASAILDDSARYLASSTAEAENVKWELVCRTEADWADLTKRLAKSKKTKAECALVKVLEQNFLPNISSLFRTKEKNEKFNINKYVPSVPSRISSRVQVLAEAKQRKEEEQKQEEAKLRAQEAKLKSDKWLAVPLKRSVPFDRQFRWSYEGIRAVDSSRRKSSTDTEADVENKRTTRNKQARNSINERAERAKKRGSVEERPKRVKEEEYDDDEEDEDSS